MPARHQHSREFDFQHAGFSVFSGKPNPELRHRHNEIELAVFEHGSIVALYGGRQMTVPPDRLVVFWGAMPHRAMRMEVATLGHGIRVPLPWVLQWKLPEALVRRLLNFEVILGRKRESPCPDLALMKNWVHLMRSSLPENREIVLLDVHARLLRLAAETGDAARGSAGTAADSSGGNGLFERILEIVSARYPMPLRIPEIARELHVSRTHVMRHFRKLTGLTLLEYITQRRVSCAQRLLATTDLKILDIAAESGFNSPARFYPCFQRLVGQSPARYRKTVRGRKAAGDIPEAEAT